MGLWLRIQWEECVGDVLWFIGGCGWGSWWN
jgi:hypothetical protein